MRFLITVSFFLYFLSSPPLQAADGPLETRRIDQAIESVRRKGQGQGGMRPGLTQVVLRIARIRYFKLPYEFKKEHIPAWQNLMNDEKASIYGRMCAAIYLMDHDQNARAFLKQHSSSENLRHRNNALAALGFAIDDGSSWALEDVLALIDSGFLDKAPKVTWSSTSDAFRDFPEGDFTDIGEYMLGDLCHRLRKVKSAKSVPVLIRLIERKGYYHEAVRALEEIGDQRAVPVLLKLFRQSPADSSLISAMGSLNVKEAMPELLNQLDEIEKRQPSEQWWPALSLLQALSNMNDQAAVPALKEFSYSIRVDPKVRKLAHVVVVKLSHPEPVAELAKLFEENDDEYHGTHMIDIAMNLNDAKITGLLKKIAASGKYAIWRRDAIKALGVRKNRAALLALASLLDVNYPANLPGESGWKVRPDFSVYFPNEIMRVLAEATNQDYGSHKEMWEEWIKSNIKN